MKIFFSVLYFLFVIKTNQKEISDENKISDHLDNDNLAKNPTKTTILNMNIIGNNIEVNFDQNHKPVSGYSSEVKDKKQVKRMNSGSPEFGSLLNYPDYVLEVEAPNSSQIFSQKISKRSEDINSLNNLIKNNEKFNSTKYLELSVFVDFKAHQNLKTIGLIKTEELFHELILCYINQIQAIYSHKSFDTTFLIYLVKIEIQKTDMFSKSGGNRDQMLKEFCEYQANLNPLSDSDPMHWDMALLLTGYDLFVVKDDGTRDYKSLGLGSVSGICSLERNCVISEFQVINHFGELWPSSGLMSSWAGAHEMAHNLGILHDGWPFNIECPRNGYLMSSSRGTRGETNWSECSVINFHQSYTECLDDRPIITDESFDHNKYDLRPGALWDSDIQCKLFLMDNKAYEFPKSNERICNETIFCATPNRKGYFSSGPALEGTNCGHNKWCVNGLCQLKVGSDFINLNNV